MTENVFFKLPEDVVLNIISKLEEDPRNWAFLACVCTKFNSLMRDVCCKIKCSSAIPAVVADLISGHYTAPPGGWAALYKISVCCPGLVHAGVLLENSDFGLERELGPDESYRKPGLSLANTIPIRPFSNVNGGGRGSGNGVPSDVVPSDSDCSWSLFDDLYFDTVYNASDSIDGEEIHGEVIEKGVVKPGRDVSSCKRRRKIRRSVKSHLASGVWNLSREQGNKLLASRFRGDCLYISDWPGCIHVEEKRNYMLFRGVFKNFKQSRVWRTINDGSRSKIDINCEFCSCKETWDLHSAFCLRRVFGYHDDGDPVVRAYVCENGHVSGAWTELPLYT